MSVVGGIDPTSELSPSPPSTVLDVSEFAEALSGSWEECQRVGQAAHQLEMHGLLAPAATGMGLTLSLFDRHLTPEERPRLVEAELWDRLPADPRRPVLAHEEQEARSRFRKQSSY